MHTVHDTAHFYSVQVVHVVYSVLSNNMLFKKNVAKTFVPLIVMIIVLCPTKIVNWSDICPVKKKYVSAALVMPDHVSGLVFLFSCPPKPLINHLNFYCIKQIDYFSVRACVL